MQKRLEHGQKINLYPAQKYSVPIFIGNFVMKICWSHKKYGKAITFIHNIQNNFIFFPEFAY